MGLPIKWVEKIFSKLLLNYGTEFSSRYKGQDIMDVKTDWSEELAFLEEHPESITFALCILPDKPPTAQQFKALTLLAPRKADLLLPYTPASKELVKEVLQTMKPPSTDAWSPMEIRGGWALKILAEHRAGIPRTPTVVRMARDAVAALGISS